LYRTVIGISYRGISSCRRCGSAEIGLVFQECLSFPIPLAFTVAEPVALPAQLTSVNPEMEVVMPLGCVMIIPTNHLPHHP
jgi:hypothetical protein